ncbi:MAG TPA: hypothetical protein VGL76_08535 [Gaiellaceae bacterium]
MITLVILFLLVALAIAFTLALGAGPFVIVPAVAAFAVGVWFLVGLVGGRTPGREVRRTEKAELLGPGGPDDPDANP